MEPVTHFLTGATLARAGFNRKTALATVTMTLAAEAADIDIAGVPERLGLRIHPAPRHYPHLCRQFP